MNKTKRWYQPNTRAKKFSKELKEEKVCWKDRFGKQHTSTLTKEQKAYRIGYLAARHDAAELFKFQNEHHKQNHKEHEKRRLVQDDAELAMLLAKTRKRY